MATHVSNGSASFAASDNRCHSGQRGTCAQQEASLGGHETRHTIDMGGNYNLPYLLAQSSRLSYRYMFILAKLLDVSPLLDVSKLDVSLRVPNPCGTLCGPICKMGCG